MSSVIEAPACVVGPDHVDAGVTVGDAAVAGLPATQRAIKHALDPKGLLNPGKKVP